MIASFFFHTLVYPLSFLPMRILYVFSDVFYLLLITVFPYRRKVIEGNIVRSFPNWSERERKSLRRKFYRHFADLLLEGVKNLSISKRALRRRVRVKNPELMAALYTQGKSVLLVSGHYNNWEWLITAQNLLFPHQAVGIGMPLSNPFWDQKLNELRARNGMIILHSKNVKTNFNQLKNDRIATLILSDQSPGDSRKSYWMDFLNQPTAVLFGCEQLAHTYGHAVVFYHMRKIRRGYYEMELSLITDDPSTCKWGEITEKHTRMLERAIQEDPAHWVWSHKRWKRKLPDDLEALRQEQRAKFETTFGTSSAE